MSSTPAIRKAAPQHRSLAVAALGEVSAPSPEPWPRGTGLLHSHTANSKGGAKRYAVALVASVNPAASPRNGKSRRTAKYAIRTSHRVSIQSFFAPEACRIPFGKVAQNNAAIAWARESRPSAAAKAETAKDRKSV